MNHKAYLICLLTLFLPTALVKGQETFDNYQVFQVGGISAFGNEEEFFSKLNVPLEEGMEILHEDATRGVVQVLVKPEHIDRFKEGIRNNKLSYEVTIDDVGKLIEPLPPILRHNLGEVTFENYMNYEEIEAYLKNLGRRYPAKVKLSRIGKSFNLANITMVTISEPLRRSKGQVKPVIFLEAGIHPREWIGIASAIYLIKKLSESTSLTSNVEWRIVPVANPDGYKYTFTGNRLWRKNRRRHYHSQCYGVDLNRNFDAYWQESGTSKRACSAVYGGKEAFSEPETAALRDAILEVKNRLKAYISLHSYGQYILYPPGTESQKLKAKSHIRLDSYAQKMAKSIKDSTKMNYTVGSPTKLLYAASGLSMDWALMSANVPLSFTFEMRDTGKYGFLLPRAQIQESVKDIWVAMKTLYNEIHNYRLPSTGSDILLRSDSSVEDNGVLISFLQEANNHYFFSTVEDGHLNDSETATNETDKPCAGDKCNLKPHNCTVLIA